MPNRSGMTTPKRMMALPTINKVKLTGWRDVATAALAARNEGKNLCPQSLPGQKGEKARFCSSESRRGVLGLLTNGTFNRDRYFGVRRQLASDRRCAYPEDVVWPIERSLKVDR
jgi:hypothetical protein